MPFDHGRSVMRCQPGAIGRILSAPRRVPSSIYAPDLPVFVRPDAWGCSPAACSPFHPRHPRPCGRGGHSSLLPGTSAQRHLRVARGIRPGRFDARSPAYASPDLPRAALPRPAMGCPPDDTRASVRSRTVSSRVQTERAARNTSEAGLGDFDSLESGWHDSNVRPRGPEPRALPTAPHPEGDSTTEIRTPISGLRTRRPIR